MTSQTATSLTVKPQSESAAETPERIISIGFKQTPQGGATARPPARARRMRPVRLAAPRVAFMQDGARLHYALPAALHRAGLLTHVYTEWYNDQSPVARLQLAAMRCVQPGIARRLGECKSSLLQGAAIIDAKTLGLLQHMTRHCLGESSDWFSRLGRMIGRRRLAHGPLATQGADILFAFSPCVDKEMVEALHQRGIRVVLDQAEAPAAELAQQMRLNGVLWPHWAMPDATLNCDRQAVREIELLQAADHVTCPSAFVRSRLIEQGVPAQRISLMPYPVDVSDYPAVNRAHRTGPMTVGFVGEVGLRKGAPWFYEVARRCAGTDIRFVMVGNVQLPSQTQAMLGQKVELVGPVPRSQVFEWLSRFDVLLFPSTCEGSPSAVMEAMATGLPVVTTPTSGTLVRPGTDGYIAPYDQPDALAAFVLKLAGNRPLRLAMGLAAQQRAKEFSIEHYAKRINVLMRRVHADDLPDLLPRENARASPTPAEWASEACAKNGLVASIT